MTHKELVDQVSANLFKQSGKIESQKSWLAMRNYLEQLDSEQLKMILKEAIWYKQKLNFLTINSRFYLLLYTYVSILYSKYPKYMNKGQFLYIN